MQDFSDNIDTAILIAGGEGTRLRPLTYDIPKPLIKVNGKPLIEYAIEELERNNISHILVSVGYKADKIIDYINSLNSKNSKCKVDYVIEDKPLGTGGAIRFSLSKIAGKKNIIVANADTIFSIDINEMLAIHRKESALATIATKKVSNVKGFGVVDLDGRRIVRFVEKPDPSTCSSSMINAGIYLLNIEIMQKLPDKESFSFEKDFLQASCSSEKLISFPINYFITVNDYEQLKAAESALKARNNVNRHML